MDKLDLGARIFTAVGDSRQRTIEQLSEAEQAVYLDGVATTASLVAERLQA